MEVAYISLGVQVAGVLSVAAYVAVIIAICIFSDQIYDWSSC